MPSHLTHVITTGSPAFPAMLAKKSDTVIFIFPVPAHDSHVTLVGTGLAATVDGELADDVLAAPAVTDVFVGGAAVVSCLRRNGGMYRGTVPLPKDCF